MQNQLAALSDDLAAAVAAAGRAVVAVNGRARFSSSGVHWRPGAIVTAEHSLKRDDEISVALPDGKSIPATLAGRDAGTDLAVLRIDAPGLPLAERASGDPGPGNLVLAVGRSEETGVSAALGAVSAVAGKWRTWRGGVIDAFLRLDVSLYPGSSGSAAVGADGLVFGVATSGLSRLAPVAVPARTVDRVVDELLAKGHVSRGYLGVGLQPVRLPEHLIKRLALAGGAGVIVLSVEPEGPASQAGVLIGDIVVKLGEQAVTDTDDVQTALASAGIGGRVQAGIVRAGELVHIELVVGERPRRSQ